MQVWGNTHGAQKPETSLGGGGGGGGGGLRNALQQGMPLQERNMLIWFLEVVY